MYERASWHEVTAQGDEALTRYLIHQGLELNLSTFPVQFRRRLGEYFAQREKDLLETTYTYVLLELLKDKGYANMSDEVVRKALDSLFAITQTNWILEDDTLPTLKKLEKDGYRMGLISNAGDDQDVQQLIRRFEISTYFDFILTSASCSYRKPHPRIFELAVANWYFLPSETVMVGDNLDASVFFCFFVISIFFTAHENKSLDPFAIRDCSSARRCVYGLRPWIMDSFPFIYNGIQCNAAREHITALGRVGNLAHPQTKVIWRLLAWTRIRLAWCGAYYGHRLYPASAFWYRRRHGTRHRNFLWRLFSVHGKEPYIF